MHGLPRAHRPTDDPTHTAQARELLMSLRLALVLLLTCLSFPLMARDIRQLGPNSGACDDSTAADEAAASAAPVRSAAQAARAVPSKVRPPAVRSSGDGVGDIRPPRWHSFLPGMFR